MVVVKVLCRGCLKELPIRAEVRVAGDGNLMVELRGDESQESVLVLIAWPVHDAEKPSL
jgi:hypothetical protein